LQSTIAHTWRETCDLIAQTRGSGTGFTGSDSLALLRPGTVLAKEVVLAAQGDNGLTGLLVETVGWDVIGGVPGHGDSSEKAP
jgi:hypothetical protein